MKLRISCLVLLFPLSVCAGENGGVAEQNFEAGAEYDQDRDSSGYGLNGAYRLPIAEYFGASLSASAGHTNGEGNRVDSDAGAIEGAAFLRDFEVGKLGLAYRYSHTEFQLGHGFDDVSVNDNTYNVFGQYYWGNFTLIGSRTIVKTEDFDDFNAWFLGVKAYLPYDVSVSGGAGGMDAEDNYSVSAEYQPAFLNQSTSIELGYSKSPHNDSFQLQVNYFFGTNVSLKQRDRQYR